MKLILEDIARGPQQVEEAISRQLVEMQGRTMTTEDRYRWLLGGFYTHYFEGDNEDEVNAFVEGYLCRQVGIHAVNLQEKDIFFKKALAAFLGINYKRLSGDARYFVQFSIGSLKRALSYPWPEAKTALQRAFELVPDRGEAFADIIDYYLSHAEWAKAHFYSIYAIEYYYQKMPLDAGWGVDIHFYGWKVLEMHVIACVSLQLEDEAHRRFLQLVKLTETSPGIFPEGQIDRILSNRKIFETV